MLPPPWIRLLIGPTATRILELADRAPYRVTVEDVAVLSYLMSAAVVRGAQMLEEGRLSKKQERDLGGLYDTVIQLREILEGAGVSPDRAEAMAIGRLANPDGGALPEREVELALSPANADSRVLIERVVDLYQPVFRHEPKVTLQKKGGSLIVYVHGPDPELVDQLAATIYLTLGANKYKGRRQAPASVMRLVSNPPKSRNPSGPYLNPAALKAALAQRQRNVSSLRRRLSR